MSTWDRTKHNPSMDDFKTDNWEKLTPQERKNSLQYLENKVAAEEGRSPRKIKVDKTLKAGECGYYSDSVFNRNNIYINEDYLYSNAPSKQYEAMDTVLHEGRHAYQSDCVKGRIEPHKDDESKLSDWKKNSATEEYNPFGNDKTSYSYYRFQPVENDANDFAKKKMEGYSDIYSSDPNYRNHIETTQKKQNEDELNAQNRLGKDYKENIANDIRDRYDYRHKIGDYDESNKGVTPKNNYSNDSGIKSQQNSNTVSNSHSLKSETENSIVKKQSNFQERGTKPSQENNHPSKKEASSERGQKPSSIEGEARSKGAERGQKPSEGENRSQGNNSTPRGERPQKATQSGSNATTQKGTPRGSVDGANSKSVTPTTNPGDKSSVNSNSTKAAEGASKATSDQAAQNIASKSNGMGM